ncbi:hypothetical protein BKA67DRAFT_564334 [Truncatella angustata]|uniref:Uncharacterized protein n=1 Tax=Truncatella angustata TaxID=152316 RepID=A0A9P8ZXI9_9PEZI|nr:uncharacterized protein BKA67DRAFT_564334 [Truncatella angustata]KAH6654168.1 hypothetical protein BKA67DRAFT_564334 [Truncatella angustata]
MILHAEHALCDIRKREVKKGHGWYHKVSVSPQSCISEKELIQTFFAFSNHATYGISHPVSTTIRIESKNCLTTWENSRLTCFKRQHTNTMSGLKYIWPDKPDKPEVTESPIFEADKLIHAAATWANEMHRSLSGIRENTSRYLFWTFLFCMIITSLLLLHTLNSLWYQLAELNTHQSTYKQMWIEEREEMAAHIERDVETRAAMFEQLTRQLSAAVHAQPHGPGQQQQRNWQYPSYQGSTRDEDRRQILQAAMREA